MWIVNFFKELRVWRTIRKVCKENNVDVMIEDKPETINEISKI